MQADERWMLTRGEVPVFQVSDRTPDTHSRRRSAILRWVGNVEFGGRLLVAFGEV